MTTRAPRRAAMRAVASPMPDEAPVMTMTWSLSFFGVNFMAKEQATSAPALAAEVVQSRSPQEDFGMFKHIARIALAIGACVAAGAAGITVGAQSYQLPPKVVVDILDAAPTPVVLLSPDRATIALLERRSMPTIAEISEPIHRLAGARINPRTNGRQQRIGAGVGISLKPIAGGADRMVTLPPAADVGGLEFSPNGKYLSFTNTKPNGIELWVADVAS